MSEREYYLVQEGAPHWRGENRVVQNIDCHTSAVYLALNAILIGWLVITWPYINLNVFRSGYIFIKCIPSEIHWGERDKWPGNARDQNVTKAVGVIVAWCFEAHFSAIPRNFSLVFESSWNKVERFEAKTSAFYFFFERSKKTFREEGFRKSLESKLVLHFLLRRINLSYRCAAVNASLFAPFLTCSPFRCITKEIMCVPSENKFPLGRHRDSRENKTNCLPRDRTLSVYYMLVNQMCLPCLPHRLYSRINRPYA